jgi:hypothetical protein
MKPNRWCQSKILFRHYGALLLPVYLFICQHAIYYINNLMAQSRIAGPEYL